MVHPAGGYEVEFMTLDGETIAVTSPRRMKCVQSRAAR